MKNIPVSEKSFQNWLAAGLLFIIAIILFYSHSVYNSLGMNITRGEAEAKASALLTKLGFDVSDYQTETSVSENMLLQLYFMQELNSTDFHKYQDKYIPNHGWRIFFHQNLSPLVPQTNYRVLLNRDGKILRFTRNIPDTSYLPTINESVAERVIREFISTNTTLDLSEFEMTESREERLAKRTDYSFRWQKVERSSGGNHNIKR
jgi:hypothetical protein